MGAKDNKITPYLQKPENFCGLLNGGVFNGKPILSPEKLTLLPGQQSVELTGKDDVGKKKKKSYTFHHDVVMKADWGGYYAILSCEDQSHIHYGMPLRMLQYDVLEYIRQVKEIEEKNRAEKNLKSGAEFLSGMTKEDFLQPVVGVVFYHGEEPWDGAKSMTDMVHLPADLEELREFIPQYKIHLIDPRTVNLEHFTGAWRTLMEVLRYMGDKQGFASYVENHAEELDALSIESGEVLLTLLGENRRLTEGKEAVTVCTALEELKEDWKNEGIHIGEARGEARGAIKGENRIISLVTCMIRDGLSNEILRLDSDENFKRAMLGKYQL